MLWCLADSCTEGTTYDGVFFPGGPIVNVGGKVHQRGWIRREDNVS